MSLNNISGAGVSFPNGIDIKSNIAKYDFETWKEVQNQTYENWKIRLFSEMKNVANADILIGDWNYVKECIEYYTESMNVKEEFTYTTDIWLEEIYVKVKPLFIEWLDNLSHDKELDFSDYIASFWNDK